MCERIMHIFALILNPLGGNLKQDNSWAYDFDAVLFDFDGTIADTGYIWQKVDRKFMEDRGLEYTEDLGPKLAALGFKNGAEWIVDTYNLNETPEQVCQEWNEAAERLYAQEVVLKEGVMDYIDNLHAMGKKTALVTTNNKRVLTSISERVDVYDIFNAVVLGDEVPRSKHFPDIYLEAASRLDIDPELCLVFEDIPMAINSAHEAGMTTCAVDSNDPWQNIEELKAMSDYFIHTWDEIPL